MEYTMNNITVEPKEPSSSAKIEPESLLAVRVVQDTPIDDEDDCAICYQTLYRPVKTGCGHVACESCMLHWALTAMDAARGAAELPPTLGIAVEGIKFKCPTCRTYAEAKLDSKRNDELLSKYPKDYAARAAEEEKSVSSPTDEHSTQTMVIMYGNSHRKVPPSVSPDMGNTREHEWTFFVQSSRKELIEKVEVVLHPTYREDRLVTLRQVPFSTTHLASSYFTLFVGLQLKEGYQWVDEDRAVDSNTDKGLVKDRLPIEWLLDFGGNGSHRHKIVKFRRMKPEECTEPDGEEDLDELAMFMSEAEVAELREVRRLKAAARREQVASEST